MFNLGIFTTLVYLSPNILRAQGKLRNLSNMYEVLFSTEPSVTLVYSELKAYSGPSQTSIIEKILMTTLRIPNIFRTVAYSESKAFLEYCQTSITKYFTQSLVNPHIFRTLVYSELWYILKSKHIQNAAVYLRWSILFRTICTYSWISSPTYSKLSHNQNSVCQLLLNVSFIF